MKRPMLLHNLCYTNRDEPPQWSVKNTSVAKAMQLFFALTEQKITLA